MVKLSVITVTYNDLPGLRSTLTSLSSLVEAAGSEIEVIVCDGGTPGIQGAVQFEGGQVALYSQSDEGIYDAMNRGLSKSRGTHVWFLNGGDECLERDWRRLRADLDRVPDSVLLFGYVRRVAGKDFPHKPRKPSYLWHGLPTSHQAIIYPGRIVRSIGYDLSYTMTADYALTARLFLEEQLSWRQIHRNIARFAVGGHSTKGARQIETDAHRVQDEILRASGARKMASRARHRLSRTLIALMLVVWKSRNLVADEK